jgi:hypothetical protein
MGEDIVSAAQGGKLPANLLCKGKRGNGFR